MNIRFLLFLWLCSFASAIAQNKLDSIQHLQDVYIVAKPFQQVIPSQKLSGVQLEKLNSHSVADALRFFSGVQIKDYGGVGGIKTVDVRNMGTYHVGVFYDGIQLGNAQNGVVDLGKFSLDDMEEINLYNGQKSEIFQPAKDFASASAIYLKTKRPKFINKKKTNLIARYKAGSIHLINPSLRLEQKLNDKLSLSLSSEYIKSNGKYKFRYKRDFPDGTVAYDTTATRRNGDIEAMRIETGFYGSLLGGFLESKLYYYGSDRGLPGAIVKNEFYNGARLTDKNFFAQAGYTKDVSDRYKFQIKAKFAYDYTHFISRDSVEFMDEDVSKNMHYDNTFYQQEVYISTANVYSILPKWNVSLSADFQWNKLNGAMRGINTPFSFPRRYTTLAAMATSLDLGKWKAQASVLGTFVQETVKNNTASPDKTEFTPAVFLGYTPFKQHDFTLRAFYKRIFRMPSFNDLYYAEFGYSELKPEYTNQYNIGFSYNKAFDSNFLEQIMIQADAYHQNVTDKIVASPKGTSNFRWMMTNMGKVKGYGINTTMKADGKIDKVKLSANLSYTYSDARTYEKLDGHPLTSDGDQIPYTPWHSGSVVLNSSYRSWYLNYSFIYVGERYDGGVNNNKRNYVQPWYTHDMSVQKEFTYKQNTVKASLEINNLLNQYYDVVLNYPMPGRNFRFILSFDL